MLFSYENRKNKFAINFSSPRLRRINTCNFTSGWLQNSVFVVRRKKNLVLRCVVYGCSDKEDEKRGFASTKFPSTLIQDRKP